MFRYIQLYGIIFYFYYETWPSSLRLWFTGMFSAFNFNFYILNQEDFYDFMADFGRVKIFLFGALCATLFFYGISIIFLSARKLRFRIENKQKRSGCNFYSVWFWIMEIMMLPLLFNISWPATCNFWSARDAIELTDCKEDGMPSYWIMKSVKILAFISAIAYNGYLFAILNRNKINSAYHEESVVKKEIEFVYEINNIWINEQFYTFSSFRSGLLNMYHRIINNMFAIVMVAIAAFGVSKNCNCLSVNHLIPCLIL